jgi:hypothetical protein
MLLVFHGSFDAAQSLLFTLRTLWDLLYAGTLRKWPASKVRSMRAGWRLYGRLSNRCCLRSGCGNRACSRGPTNAQNTALAQSSTALPPLRGCVSFAFVSTAYAVGCILAPLRGLSFTLRFSGSISRRAFRGTSSRPTCHELYAIRAPRRRFGDGAKFDRFRYSPGLLCIMPPSEKMVVAVM